MLLQRPRDSASFEENLTRQLTSLRQSVRDDAAKTLDQLSPEASLRILSEVVEKAYSLACRRRPWMLALFCACVAVAVGIPGIQGLAGVVIGSVIFGIPNLIRLLRGPVLSDAQLQLVSRFNEQVKRATLPSAVGPILDVLRWPMNYPAERAILKVELKRLLALGDDETVASLTPMQLQTLAQLIRPLDNPELGIAGLLTLASARYADAELLKKTATLALTDAPLGLAAREYRRAVGEPVA